jgi:hypothetical protein
MVSVPGWVWRFGTAIRSLIVGLAIGVVLGFLALISSNSVPSGAVAVVVITIVYALITARRMAKFWPGAKSLSGDDRVAVARAVRGGHEIRDSRLAPAVIEYSEGICAAGHGRLTRWLVVLLAAVALGVAIADTIFSPAGEAIVSWLYFAIFPIELLWWPRREAQLLVNAENAAESARQLLTC